MNEDKLKKIVDLIVNLQKEIKEEIKGFKEEWRLKQKE